MATVPAPSGTATSAPAPDQTNTPQTVMTETPAATTPLPANSPTPQQRATPAPPRVFAPLQALDSGTMFSELADAEKECIGENPERQTRYIGCLEDETIDRIFLAGFVPKPKPRWDVHMAGVGNLDGGYAGAPLLLIAGWSGSGA